MRVTVTRSSREPFSHRVLTRAMHNRDDQAYVAANAMKKQQDCAREKTTPEVALAKHTPIFSGDYRNGVPLISARQPSAVVTTEQVNDLREQGP